MHDDASTSDQCPTNLDVVVDSFLEETSINYVFTTDATQMHKLMLSHGLHDRNLNQNECGRALCYHILNGLCAAIPADNDLKRSACSDISGSCLSPAELQDAISELVVERVALRMSLKTFRRLCASIDIPEYAFARRKLLITRFQERRERLQHVVCKQSLFELFDYFDGMRKPMLINIAIGHGLQVDSSWTIDDLRNAITKHVTGAQCCLRGDEEQVPTQCQSINDEFPHKDPELDSSDEIQSRILESIVDRLSASPLRRILQIHEIPSHKEESTSRLRRRLRKYTRSLRKGKRSHQERRTEANRRLQQVRAEWPRVVPNDLKDRIHKLFREQTSSERLKEFTCASCAQSQFVDERVVLPASELDLDLLQRPDMHDADVGSDTDDDESERPEPWLDSDCAPPILPFTDGPLQNLLLDPAGVDLENDGDPTLSLCQQCSSSLEKGVVPPLALANRLFLGEVPRSEE